MRRIVRAGWLWVVLCGQTFAQGQTCLSLAQRHEKYEWLRAMGLRPTKELKAFAPKQGITVVARDANGQATRVKVRVLADNPNVKIQIVGPFNNWGKNLRPEDTLKPLSGEPYAETELSGLTHGTEYRFLVDGKQVLDPAAEVFTSKGYHNSQFFDFEWTNRPGGYRARNKPADIRDQPIAVAEAEVYALVKDWVGPNGERLTDPKNTYEFIATSGVAKHLAEKGYNAVEFLPFNASLDPANWAFRYQVFGLFAPDSRYGSPDAFAKMVDAFSAQGIVVIMDAVVGHYPKTGNDGNRNIGQTGLHVWKKADGQALYGERASPWGTNRYDYQNPYVRRFLIDSILTMFKRYGIAGIRFDNLDGIRFEPGGTQFLLELVQEIRAYRPESILIGEMFFGDNRVMRGLADNGLGIDMRTHSDLFDWFKDFGQKPTEQLNLDQLRNAIRNPWNWQEAARIQYITNHDEAANRRNGMTGNYPASLLDGGGDYYTQRKTIVFGAVAMLSGSAYMDLPQMRHLQRGSFSANPEIEWGKAANGAGQATDAFFRDMTQYYRSQQAFAFKNFHPNIENHTDNNSKVMSLRRFDSATGKEIYILINFSHKSFDNYAFGVVKDGNYAVKLNSDGSQYGGSGALTAQSVQTQAKQLHGKDHTLVVPHLAPISIVVLEK